MLRLGTPKSKNIPGGGFRGSVKSSNRKKAGGNVNRTQVIDDMDSDESIERFS